MCIITVCRAHIAKLTCLIPSCLQIESPFEVKIQSRGSNPHSSVVHGQLLREVIWREAITRDPTRRVLVDNIGA